MKQVILTITHYHQFGRDSSKYTISSYPMHDYQVEEYIQTQKPTNPFCEISDVKIIDIE